MPEHDEATRHDRRRRTHQLLGAQFRAVLVVSLFLLLGLLAFELVALEDVAPEEPARGSLERRDAVGETHEHAAPGTRGRMHRLAQPQTPRGQGAVGIHPQWATRRRIAGVDRGIIGHEQPPFRHRRVEDVGHGQAAALELAAARVGHRRALEGQRPSGLADILDAAWQASVGRVAAEHRPVAQLRLGRQRGRLLEEVCYADSFATQIDGFAVVLLEQVAGRGLGLLLAPECAIAHPHPRPHGQQPPAVPGVCLEEALPGGEGADVVGPLEGDGAEHREGVVAVAAGEIAARDHGEQIGVSVGERALEHLAGRGVVCLAIELDGLLRQARQLQCSGILDGDVDGGIGGGGNERLGRTSAEALGLRHKGGRHLVGVDRLPPIPGARCLAGRGEQLRRVAAGLQVERALLDRQLDLCGGAAAGHADAPEQRRGPRHHNRTPGHPRLPVRQN